MGLEERMAADAVGLQLPPDEDLRRIATLASEQVALEDGIEQAEQELGRMKARLDELRDKTLSDLLLQHGLSEIKLADGRRVKVNKMVFASIKADAKSAAHAWLEEHGHGALVRVVLVLDAGKGNSAKIAKLRLAAAKAGVECRDQSVVHPQTLKAFVAEQLDKGADVPADLFGVHVVNRTKIK